MQCRCERCGAAFEGSGERRFCDACLKKIRTEQTHACKRTCAICGQEFVGGLRAKYCNNCRIIAQREQQRQYKRMGAARPLGSIDHCAKCGAEYNVESGTQKYCKACAETAVRDNIRRRRRDYNKTYDMPHVKPKRYCVICGKEITTPKNTITCSAECAKIRKAQRQARADYNRGHRLDDVEGYAPTKAAPRKPKY